LFYWKEGSKDTQKLIVDIGNFLPTRIKINKERCLEIHFTEMLESTSLNGTKASVMFVGLKIQDSNGSSSSYVVMPHMRGSTNPNAYVNLSVPYARISS